MLLGKQHNKKYEQSDMVYTHTLKDVILWSQPYTFLCMHAYKHTFYMWKNLVNTYTKPYTLWQSNKQQMNLLQQFYFKMKGVHKFPKEDG